MKRERKYTTKDAARLVRALDHASNPRYIANITQIPINKVLQVKEALRIK